jgi:hypothetical protein
MTEQGEVINAKYGLRGIAMRTLEQTVSAVALATALPRVRCAGAQLERRDGSNRARQPGDVPRARVRRSAVRRILQAGDADRRHSTHGNQQPPGVTPERRSARRDRAAARHSFPGIIGYDDTVMPQIVNAILSRHNFILLGLRGQAKTRILRALVDAARRAMPVVAGLRDQRRSARADLRACRARVARKATTRRSRGWPRDARYVEKLATPDVTIADMIGDIDPIKAARGGHSSPTS